MSVSDNGDFVLVFDSHTHDDLTHCTELATNNIDQIRSQLKQCRKLWVCPYSFFERYGIFTQDKKLCRIDKCCTSFIIIELHEQLVSDKCMMIKDTGNGLDKMVIRIKLIIKDNLLILLMLCSHSFPSNL